MRADGSPTRTLLHAIFGVVLLGAVLVGGGQGGLLNQVLVIPALLLIGLSLHSRLSTPSDGVPPALFYGIPACLLLLPLLQLVPIPPVLWLHLPGRSDVADALRQAGASPQWMAWSIAPQSTERILWDLMVPLAVFWAGMQMPRTAQRRWLVVLLILAVLNVVLGLAQIQGGGQSDLYGYDVTNVGFAVGTFANRNHLASFLVMLFPLVVATLLEFRQANADGPGRLQAWWLVLVLVFIAVGVTLTQSRAGFALLMVAVVCAASLAARPSQRAAVSRRPWLPIGMVVVGLLIVQYTLYALLLRLSIDPLDDLRWLFARNAIIVAAQASGFGWGLGSFVHAYDLIGDASAAQPFFVNHAHNDYLELWLEGGVLAAALIGAAVVGLAIHSVRTLRTLRTPDASPLKLAAILALWLVLAHSVVDYPLRTTAIQALAAFLLSISLGDRRGYAAPADLTPTPVPVSTPVRATPVSLSVIASRKNAS